MGRASGKRFSDKDHDWDVARAIPPKIEGVFENSATTHEPLALFEGILQVRSCLDLDSEVVDWA